LGWPGLSGGVLGLLGPLDALEPLEELPLAEAARAESGSTAGTTIARMAADAAAAITCFIIMFRLLLSGGCRRTGPHDHRRIGDARCLGAVA